MERWLCTLWLGEYAHHFGRDGRSVVDCLLATGPCFHHHFDGVVVYVLAVAVHVVGHPSGRTSYVRELALAGVCLGACTLVRPTSMPILAIIAAYLWWQ